MGVAYNVAFEVRKVNSDFSRVMTLLRKEKKISQKKAAADLGVSQGLLSHYEKGKRECGLDFLVKAADYYAVSCDYLLGRSPEPQGKTILVDEIADDDSNQKSRLSAGGVMVTFNKKLIVNSINVLFGLLEKTKSSVLVREVSSFIMLAVYKMIRVVYSTNKKNDENFFTVPKTVASPLSDAAMSMSYAAAKAAATGTVYNGNDAVKETDDLYITTATLSEQFPAQYSSVVNLIKNSESRINELKDFEK